MVVVNIDDPVVVAAVIRAAKPEELAGVPVRGAVTIQPLAAASFVQVVLNVHTPALVAAVRDAAAISHVADSVAASSRGVAAAEISADTTRAANAVAAATIAAVAERLSAVGKRQATPSKAQVPLYQSAPHHPSP